MSSSRVLGEAPVDDDGLAELADEDVGGLEVAVDDALAVGVGDRLGDGEHVGQERRGVRGGLAPADEVGEGAPGDELHRVEGLAVGPASGLVDGDDRGVLEARR
jgi:hypothetical protein